MLAKRLLTALLAITPGIAAASDRSVAEWVLRVGGSVVVEGQQSSIWDISRLPAKDFALAAINLTDVLMEPDDLQKLSGLSHFKELYLSRPTYHTHPVPLTHPPFTA